MFKFVGSVAELMKTNITIILMKNKGFFKCKKYEKETSQYYFNSGITTSFTYIYS